ncbi:MAG: DnaJ domain-containing protein [Thermodesulfobacteriota bacterium]
MKDYYKILGVKETASEEEIRNRWIELTKHYHPDLGEGNKVDERIKEINEAYQVLKYSSTRVEYDLKRNYERKKKKFSLPKLILLISGLIVSIITGTIYFEKPQDPSLSKHIVTNKTNQINQIDRMNQRNQKNQMDATPQKLSAPVDPSTQQKQRTASTTKAVKPQRRDSIDSPVPSTLQINDPTSVTNLTIPTNPIDLIDQRNQRDLKIDLAQFKPPSLIATEEEVRQFFNEYIERYTRMDIEGFLPLFSLKAIQNQKDGPEEIRKIYTKFMNLGEGIRYQMEDMKFEIYQNSVEVKARYELNQILKMGKGERTWRGRIRWVLVKESGTLKILSLDYQHQKSP